VDLLSRPVSSALVDYEVTGIVRLVDGITRITVQLIDRQTEREIWNETFDQTDETRFENGGYAGRMIEVVVAWSEGGKNLSPEANRESFELAKAGSIEWNSAAMGGSGSEMVAMRYLEEAIQVNPADGIARNQLAIIYAARAGYKFSFAEAQQRAHSYYCEARALHPDVPMMNTLAIVNFRGFLDYEAAIKNFRRAIGGNVPSGAIHVDIGWALATQGKLEEAIDSINVGIAMGAQLNAALGHRSIGMMEILLGRYQDAINSIEQAMEAEGGNSLHSGQALAEALYRAGDQEVGRTLLKELWRQHGSRRPESFPHLFALMGETALAREVLKQLYLELEAGRLFLYGPVFATHFFLGEIDQAFEWLHKAVENGEWVVIRKLRRATYLAPLREDPRFEEVMARIEELERQGTPSCENSRSFD
jgi:tetratricopeptide (TPR) repeat protein